MSSHRAIAFLFVLLWITTKGEAPVRAVKLEPVGDELKCSSEDIYPKPDLTWSSSNKTEPNTSVSVSEKGLYSIFSSVTLSHKPPEEHSCNISTDHSWSSATYRLQSPINSTGPTTTLHCADSNSTIKSLIWKFNHTQTILTQTGTNRVYNESWRQFVEEVSESGLTLKNLSSGHQGVYSCLISSDRDTLMSNTQLVKVEERNIEPGGHYDWVFVGCIVAVTLVDVTVKVVLLIYCKRRVQQQKETRGGGGQDQQRLHEVELNPTITSHREKLLTLMTSIGLYKETLLRPKSSSNSWTPLH